MNKPLRNKKTGKFTGSIGDGKTKTPQPNPTKPTPPTSPPTTEDQKIMVALIDPRALSNQIRERGAAADQEPINRIIAEYLLNDPTPSVPLILADNPTLPEDILIKLSHHKNFHIRHATIETRRLPITRQIQLAEDPNEEIRTAITLHTTHPPLIQKLAQENSHTIKAAAATNPNTPPETLETLSQNQPNKTTLGALIYNPQTPTHVIENIYYTLEEEAQDMVVANRKVSKPFAEKLATTHPSEHMRKGIKYWLTLKYQ